MSLIHEALKKAEQQRRLGQPPDLGTPFASTRRPRSSLPYLAAAIVIALGAGWWFASDSAAPAGSGADGKPSTAQAADNPASGSAAAPAAATPPAASGEAVASSSATARRPVMGANAQANTNVVDSLAPPPRLNNQAAPAGNNPPTVKEVAERESEPHPPGANPLAPGEAAPLALGAAPPPTEINDAAGLAAKMAAKERERGGLASAAPAADPARSPRKPGPPPSSLAEANAPPPNPATANAPPKATTTAPGTAKTPAAPSMPPPNPAPAAAQAGLPSAPPAPAATASAAPATAPGLEQLPAYWQLPYNMRKELPALKLSMHVYSATPAQRFVVLNGNRQVEGDELGGDVKVTEIRTDGVVLTYQGQRFLVPRGGS
ncbi:type II secretion system (T2SS) protein B [Tahibacter aquaticus]|uniref:Type II secretion system (T2SS) protein B n=1 Tax=Tahibacter aquaticus TaxID=520092 RepID=A0A4R6YSS8_9GAMM|nr:general secretion pathway protein GspB [Tahibacter aquaticus]TDR41270.1 type II secretion system (T2SS) protein B [Tahibacter aquaticus]